MMIMYIRSIFLTVRTQLVKYLKLLNLHVRRTSINIHDYLHDKIIFDDDDDEDGSNADDDYKHDAEK